MEKNDMGIVILDNLKRLTKDEKGRKQKVWLEFQNKEYLFKTGASNYEIFAEVISSELAQQCNLKSALYDIAIYNNNVGVVTPNFLKENDIILSGEDLFNYAKLFSPNVKFSNSIDDIVEVLKICTSRDYDIEKIRIELTKIWLFDGLTYESDRNLNNWSIIINGNDIRVAPIYDCSTIFRMNNDISELINFLKSDGDLHCMTKSIKYQLKRKSTDKDDNFLEAFYDFCIEEPDIAKEFIIALDNLNYTKAVEKIENRMNNGNNSSFQIPWECNFWINKLLKMRITEFKSIYEYSNSSEKIVEKKI